MDKLADQLKADAEQIDVEISEELEKRLEASLRGVSPERESKPAVPDRSGSHWWASSLTGVVAALLIVAVVNFQSRTEGPSQLAEELSPVAALPSFPVIDWQTESAMLTSPLRQELEDLRSDIRKAEQKVRNDVGL